MMLLMPTQRNSLITYSKPKPTRIFKQVRMWAIVSIVNSLIKPTTLSIVQHSPNKSRITKSQIVAVIGLLPR